MPHDPESKRLMEFLLAQLYQVRSVPEPPPFPPPESADVHGCVALGARLTPEMVLGAYRRGIFPMAEETAIGWWSPDPRTILDFDGFHVSRRLARTLRKGIYEVRVDTVLPEVIARCADRSETWISPDVEQVYTELYRQGHVHSVETWQGETLVGGLYGVATGGAFMAESMFHTARDASKVAVVALVERLKARGYELLDIQYETKATAIFRPQKIRRAEYLRRLARALTLECTFVDPS